MTALIRVLQPTSPFLGQSDDLYPARLQSDCKIASCGTALIVDDSKDIAELFFYVLQQAGYHVVAVSSAASALISAQREHFDLIVSDIGMPETDGYELARQLRRLPEYYQTPMIAITGFSEYDDHAKAVSAGFNAHLRKPVEPIKLLEIIERLRPR